MAKRIPVEWLKYGLSSVVFPSDPNFQREIDWMDEAAMVCLQEGVLDGFDEMRNLLKKAVFFDVTGAEPIREERDLVRKHKNFIRGAGYFRERYYRAIAPPYKTYWMECGVSGLEQGVLATRRTGILIECVEKGEQRFEAMAKLDPEGAPVSPSTEPRFRLEMTSFGLSRNERGVEVCPFQAQVLVDEEGSLQDIYCTLPGPLDSLISDSLPSNRMMRQFLWWMLPALEAHRIMSCRNVTTRPGPPLPPKPRKISEQLVPGGIRYHQIVVGNKVVKLDGKQDCSEEEGFVPLHTVRGNFATYTEENKLFGKYTGRFYRRPHVRGTTEAGVVGKTYKVKPEDETP